MEKIRIIYVNNADEFRLGDADMFGEKYIDDPAVEKLRRNHAVLKQKFSSVPSKIGVVTFPYMIKQWCKEEVQNIENSTTSYVPLDILRKVLDLKDKNFEDPLTIEYFYRLTSSLFSHASIGLDSELRTKREVMVGSSMLHIRKLKKDLEKVIKTAREKFGEEKIAQGLRKIYDLIGEVFPTFEDLERVYQTVKERFEANKVSIDFPLYYLPRDSCPPFLFFVSFEEHIERDPIIDTTLRYLAEGCKASGMAEIPKDIRWEVEKLQKDRFGKTKTLDSLDSLLEMLPEPKTLVTDIYIVDHFPQLKERELETHEFQV